MDKKIVIVDGFEDLYGFDERIMYAIKDYLDENKIDTEFTGKLIITIQYSKELSDV